MCSSRISAFARSSRVVPRALVRLGVGLTLAALVRDCGLARQPFFLSRGYGGALLDWLINHAKEGACDAVHLDTGYARHAAHRLYLNKGFRLNSHHMALELKAK